MLSPCRKIKESVGMTLKYSKAVNYWPRIHGMTNYCRPEHDLGLERMRIQAMLARK